MTFDMFLILLFIVSLFTSLVTEAIKKNLEKKQTEYSANVLAGIVAVILSAAVWAAYVILTATIINAHMIVYLIALMFLSWLSAMVGYDKVVQTIMQAKSKL